MHLRCAQQKVKCITQLLYPPFMFTLKTHLTGAASLCFPLKRFCVGSFCSCTVSFCPLVVFLILPLLPVLQSRGCTDTNCSAATGSRVGSMPRLRKTKSGQSKAS